MKDYYKKTEEKLSQKVTEWKVSVSQNGDRNETVVEFNTISPAGEDFYATVVVEGKPTVNEIAKSLLAYQEDFNPVAEALLWVDSEGHGKNGAPELEELIADKKHMKQEMLDLYNAITRKTKKESTMTTETKTTTKTEPVESNAFDCLAVTSVQVFPFKEGPSLGHIKALASIVLNDQLMVRGLRVMDGENGLFVGYPVDPFFKGEDFRSVCNPITRQLREHIENCVLEKYQAAIA
jgi:stage V sporulation protein G